MKTSSENLIRRLREGTPDRIARLWRRPEVSRVPSRIWLVLAVVILAVVPLLILAMLLGDTASELLRIYVGRLMSIR